MRTSNEITNSTAMHDLMENAECFRKPRKLAMNLPKPQCELGYTMTQISEILGNRLGLFTEWILNQTVGLCEGRVWTDNGYQPSCGGVAHGTAIYHYDLQRFIAHYHQRRVK